MAFHARVDKLDEPATLVADHVLVMLASEDRLEVGVGVGVANFADKPSLYQQGQCPINRAATDPVSSAGQVASQVVSSEVVMTLQCPLQHDPPGLGYPVVAALEKAYENLPRLGKKTFAVDGFICQAWGATFFLVFLFLRFHPNFPITENCD